MSSEYDRAMEIRRVRNKAVKLAADISELATKASGKGVKPGDFRDPLMDATDIRDELARLYDEDAGR